MAKIKPKWAKLIRKTKRAKLEPSWAKLMRKPNRAKIWPKWAQIRFCNVGGRRVMAEPTSVDARESARTQSWLSRGGCARMMRKTLMLYEAKVARR